MHEIMTQQSCESQTPSEISIESNHSSNSQKEQQHVRQLIRRVYQELKRMTIMQEKKKTLGFLTGPEGSGSYGGIYIVPKYSDVRKHSILVVKQ